MTTWRRLRRLSLILGVAVFGLWLAALRPTTLLGGPAGYIIVSGVSMQPGLQPGDLVVSIAQPTYGPGDAVVYRIPQGEDHAGRLIVHRILIGDMASGFSLRGDNANSQDPWMVPASDIVGRVAVDIPSGGRAMIFIRNPFVLGSVAAGIIFTLIVFPGSPPASGSSGPGSGRRRDGPEAAPAA